MAKIVKERAKPISVNFGIFLQAGSWFNFPTLSKKVSGQPAVSYLAAKKHRSLFTNRQEHTFIVPLISEYLYTSIPLVYRMSTEILIHRNNKENRDLCWNRIHERNLFGLLSISNVLNVGKLNHEPACNNKVLFLNSLFFSAEKLTGLRSQ